MLLLFSKILMLLWYLFFILELFRFLKIYVLNVLFKIMLEKSSV